MTGRTAAWLAALLAVLATFPVMEARAGSTPGRFSEYRAVVVGCIHRSDLPLAARLCDAARARIGVAAARAGVRLILAPANDERERRRRARAARAVIMVCELALTAPRDGAGQRAVHARLALVQPHDAAVERGAPDGGPGAVARPGTLELWAQDIIATGAGDALAAGIADAIGRLATNGFDAYLAGGGLPAGAS